MVLLRIALRNLLQARRRTALLVTTPERAATLPQRPGGRPILMVDPSNGSGSWSALVDAGHPAPAPISSRRVVGVSPRSSRTRLASARVVQLVVP